MKIMTIFLTQGLWKTYSLGWLVYGMLASAHLAFADSGEIPNPIAAKSFPCLIKTIAEAAIKIAVPIAVVAIIFVGLRFVLAGISGNSTKVAEARKLLLYVVIGSAIVVGSFVLATAAVQLFGAQSPGQISC